MLQNKEYRFALYRQKNCKSLIIVQIIKWRSVCDKHLQSRCPHPPRSGKEWPQWIWIQDIASGEKRKCFEGELFHLPPFGIWKTSNPVFQNQYNAIQSIMIRDIIRVHHDYVIQHQFYSIPSCLIETIQSFLDIHSRLQLMQTSRQCYTAGYTGQNSIALLNMNQLKKIYIDHHNKLNIWCLLQNINQLLIDTSHITSTHVCRWFGTNPHINNVSTLSLIAAGRDTFLEIARLLELMSNEQSASFANITKLYCEIGWGCMDSPRWKQRIISLLPDLKYIGLRSMHLMNTCNLFENTDWSSYKDLFGLAQHSRNGPSVTEIIHNNKMNKLKSIHFGQQSNRYDPPKPITLNCSGLTEICFSDPTKKLLTMICKSITKNPPHNLKMINISFEKCASNIVLDPYKSIICEFLSTLNDLKNISLIIEDYTHWSHLILLLCQFLSKKQKKFKPITIDLKMRYDLMNLGHFTGDHFRLQILDLVQNIQRIAPSWQLRINLWFKYTGINDKECIQESYIKLIKRCKEITNSMELSHFVKISKIYDLSTTEYRQSIQAIKTLFVLCTDTVNGSCSHFKGNGPNGEWKLRCGSCYGAHPGTTEPLKDDETCLFFADHN